jgi:hypothetical protein
VHDEKHSDWVLVMPIKLRRAPESVLGWQHWSAMGFSTIRMRNQLWADALVNEPEGADGRKRPATRTITEK